MLLPLPQNLLRFDLRKLPKGLASSQLVERLQLFLTNIYRQIKSSSFRTCQKAMMWKRLARYSAGLKVFGKYGRCLVGRALPLLSMKQNQERLRQRRTLLVWSSVMRKRLSKLPFRDSETCYQYRRSRPAFGFFSCSNRYVSNGRDASWGYRIGGLELK